MAWFNEAATRSFLHELHCSADVIESFVSKQFNHQRFYKWQHDIAARADGKSNEELAFLPPSEAKKIRRAIRYLHATDGYPWKDGPDMHNAILGFRWRDMVAFENTHTQPTADFLALLGKMKCTMDCEAYTISVLYGARTYDDLVRVMRDNSQLTHLHRTRYDGLARMIEYYSLTGTRPGEVDPAFAWSRFV